MFLVTLFSKKKLNLIYYYIIINLKKSGKLPKLPFGSIAKIYEPIKEE